jgi:hypothetical protein
MSVNANDAWSDLPEGVSGDFDRLSERQVQFAETELNEGHAVFPLAAVLMHDGSFDVINSHDRTSIRVALDELWDEVRARRGEFRAVAVVTDLTVEAKPNIRVTLEHERGEAFEMFMAYHKTRFRKRVQWENIRVATARPFVWGSDSAQNAADAAH